MTFRTAINRLKEKGESPSILANLVMCAGAAKDEDIATLARLLAESGRTNAFRFGTCDVASTGGPSSLSTVLCPIILRASGHIVPKIGVEGRPAGAVDVLATIPGYRVALNQLEFEEILSTSGFCHAIAGRDLAPLDGKLFALRKEVGAVDVPALVIASLLSKKLAVGLEQVVLDVRVWEHGNFGRTRKEAHELALQYCRVAELLGIRAICVLTDATRPYQPYIGRGETLLAIDRALYGEPDMWLQRHVELCFRIASLPMAETSIGTGRRNVRDVFEMHLVAQGTSLDAYHRRLARLAAHPRVTVRAKQSGYLGVDMNSIRTTLVDCQHKAETKDYYPDPIGVRLLVEPGTYVESGTPIAIIRYSELRYLEDTSVALNDAFARLDAPQALQWKEEIVRVQS